MAGAHYLYLGDTARLPYGAKSKATIARYAVELSLIHIYLFTLPPSAFSPPPEVYSTVLRLEIAPRFAELGVEFEGFNRFLRASFAQKRKTLANNLRAAGYSTQQVAAAWPVGLALQVRSEAVALDTMAMLYRGLESGAGATPAS